MNIENDHSLWMLVALFIAVSWLLLMVGLLCDLKDILRAGHLLGMFGILLIFLVILTEGIVWCLRHISISLKLPTPPLYHP